MRAVAGELAAALGQLVAVHGSVERLRYGARQSLQVHARHQLAKGAGVKREAGQDDVGATPLSRARCSSAARSGPSPTIISFAGLVSLSQAKARINSL
jgi:hypothetical protein